MINLFLLLLVSPILLQLEAQQVNPDLIATAGVLGVIRGERTFTWFNSVPFVSFFGIPYATPEERYKPPTPLNGPLDPEGRMFNATFDRSQIKCVQPRIGFGFGTSARVENEQVSRDQVHRFWHGQLSQGQELDSEDDDGGERISNQSGQAKALAYDGTEDCLALNVFTPRVPTNNTNTSYPVIVFIHGGAFVQGYGTFYMPDRLIEHSQELVIVTVNHRLGVLGFFSLETSETPGNAAMYDLIAALRWVQNYIGYFGGDPDLVTVAGQSSGGAAVSYLMLSELSKEPRHLFQRAIAGSGSALNSWAINANPRLAGLKIAKLANCSQTDDEDTEEHNLDEITTCMKMVNPDALVSALAIYQIQERQAGRLGADATCPVIQHSSWAPAPRFIARHPIQVLEQGTQLNIPFMSGATKHEGSFPLGVVYNRFLTCEECMDRINNPNFLRRQLVPTLLNAMGIEDYTGEVYNALGAKYLRDAQQSGNFTKMVFGLLDIHSVFFFQAGILRNMELHSRLNPNSYFYSFDHRGEFSVFSLLFPPNLQPPFPGGVAHGDDLIYLLMVPDLNPDDQLVSDQLVNYWINFAITGNPTPPIPTPAVRARNEFVEWPAFTEEEPAYLIVNGRRTAVCNDYPGAWAGAADELRPVDPPTTTTTEAPTTAPSTTTAEPEIPSTAEPEIPITAEPEIPSTAEPEIPITAEPEIPSTSEPEIPITAEPGVSSTTEESSTTDDSSAGKFVIDKLVVTGHFLLFLLYTFLQ